MQDHIPDALITAFERQYDSSWNDPQLRNERMAMRYGWAAAMEAKQCLHQIQEPAPATAMDALREAEAALEVAMARILKADPGHSICVTSEAKALVAVRAALAAPAPVDALATGGQAQAPMQCVECNSCGSAFDVDSYMAGYTDGKGHCLNCPGVDHSAPQQADARDADDADLIEWLSGQYLAADFQWGDPKTPVLVIEIAPTTSVCGDFRTDVRAAIAAAKEGAKNAS